MANKDNQTHVLYKLTNSCSKEVKYITVTDPVFDGKGESFGNLVSGFFQIGKRPNECCFDEHYNYHRVDHARRFGCLFRWSANNAVLPPQLMYGIRIIDDDTIIIDEGDGCYVGYIVERLNLYGCIIVDECENHFVHYVVSLHDANTGRDVERNTYCCLDTEFEELGENWPDFKGLLNKESKVKFIDKNTALAMLCTLKSGTEEPFPF